MKTRRRGATSIELLLVVPIILLAIHGMVVFFVAHLSRQRTYAALPEIGRRAIEEERRTPAFRPHSNARCELGDWSEERFSSLSEEERKGCEAMDYVPRDEMVRVRFSAKTTATTPTLPELPRSI